MQSLPLKRINWTLRFALQSKQSSFYKDLYKKHGLSAPKIKTAADFLSLPFLTREDIMSTPPLERLYIPKKKVTQWNLTSGTTSRKPLVIPKIDHPDPELDNIAGILNKIDVSTILILANMMRMNSWLRDWTGHEILSKYGLVFGDINNLELTAILGSLAEIDAIETTPSALYFFLPFLIERYDVSKIKFISLGGEFTSEARYNFFKSYFRKAYFHFRFGGTESPIYKGIRCANLRHMSPKVFHPNTDFYLYEILDGEGKPVKEGERGELVLTTVQTCAFPLIRYKTGDGLVYRPFTCRCKRRGLIELVGRVGYDFVLVSGVSIHVEMIEKAITSILTGFDHDYRLHVYEVIHQRKLMPKLVLELSKQNKGIKNIEKKIEAEFYIGSKITLKHLVDQQVFLPLEVRFEDNFDKGLKRVKIISHLN